MLVGCGNVGTQAVLLDKNGLLIKTIPGLGGTDELWYDPTTKKFYVTGNNGSNTTRFFDVVNEDGTIAQTVNLPATTSAHSITVDPFNGNVFVALAGIQRAEPLPGEFCESGLHRGIQLRRRSARAYRRCRLAGSIARWRWPSRLGATATAAEDRLSN